MKQRLHLLLISCAVLVVFCLFLNWFHQNAAVPMPVPSHTGGYYEDSFLLTLNAPENGTIYYTTDGTVPTVSSQVYSGGILLTDCSQEPNRFISRQNVMRNWLEYTPDTTPVRKGTVLRAVYVNHLGIASEVLTQTYFVGIPKPEARYTISLVFEEDDLFGEDGIYVTGKEYDEWYLAGNTGQPEPIPNFEKHIEVPAIAQIFDSDGEIMNESVFLRLQGASKRGWYEKRFILEASPELSGKNTFSAELFPGTATHSIMTKDSVVDAMICDLVSDRNVALQRSAPVSLYLNGEHLYDWYLLERYDKAFFRQHYDVDDRILVKSGEVPEDAFSDINRYEELMYWVEHTDFSDPQQWAQLNKEVDIQSYIDYLSINYYLCNWDFSDDKNYVTWCSSTVEKSPYADKRWRWAIFDVDALAFTLDHYDVANAAEVNLFSCDLPYCPTPVNETVFLRSLKNVPAFRQQFVLSFMDIVNNNFSPDAVRPVLEKHGRTLEGFMDGYFIKRPAYAAAHLVQEFSLTGALEEVTITSAQPHMGNIIVNTSSIDLSSGSWHGSYFTDYPITVTAVAKDGYQFLGWKGAANESSATLTLSVDGGISLEAVFAEET